MLPMRSIPFKVVCLLGMNDGEFPRIEHPQSFDLIARYPQRGDRAKRNDDRYVFLEALLAGRERFLVFYLGNTLRDGKELPPAVVVEELIDSLAESFRLEPESSDPGGADCFAEHRKRLGERLVVRHPLQPFSRRYFSGTEARLCSFAAEYCLAAQAREAGVRTRHAFLPAPLPAADFSPATISLPELSRYLQHPVRWFLENRLGLFLQEKSRELQDREPIHLDTLEKYQLNRDLLAMKGEGLSRPEPLLARWRGEGRVPLGQGAQAVFAEIRETVRPIVEQLLAHETGEPLPPLRREIALSPEITLHGELGNRYPSGHLYWTNSLLHGRILLPVWLEHLFLSAVAPEDQRCETIVIGRGSGKGTAQVLRFSPVPEAARVLLDLSRLFIEGLNAPMPFFPKSGLVFARTMGSGKGTEEEKRIAAFAKAKEEYLGSDFAPGEGDDPYCRQLFGEALPVTPGYALYREGKSLAFAELATRIFTPLLGRMEEL
jgi:exodeoxyribonuclease V gamma subunit